MSRPDYEHYIRSIQWKIRAERVKERNRFTCEICGNKIGEAVEWLKHPKVGAVYRLIPELCRFEDTFKAWKGNSPNCIVAHHKTYIRLGYERDEDIAAVCVACHVVITENEPRLGLAGAWEFAKDYMDEVIQQIGRADQELGAELELQRDLRRKERQELSKKSYSWLLPPKK